MTSAHRYYASCFLLSAETGCEPVGLPFWLTLNSYSYHAEVSDISMKLQYSASEHHSMSSAARMYY